MPPKKGAAGAAKPAKGAKGEESGDKGMYFKIVPYHLLDFIYLSFRR